LPRPAPGTATTTCQTETSGAYAYFIAMRKLCWRLALMTSGK